MNVATICNLDGWMQTHLARFVYLVKRAMPGAALHLVVPIDATGPTSEHSQFRQRAAAHFAQVKFVKKHGYEGRLLEYDRMRAGLPKLLGLDSLLYMDPDIDVIEDLSGLETYQPTAKLLWVSNPVEVAGIRQQTKELGLDDRLPLMEEGFIFLRGNLLSDFDEVWGTMRTRGLVGRTIAPGMVIWTLLSRNVYAVQMPDLYNTTMRAPMTRIVNAKSLHFTGSTKDDRPYYRYPGCQNAPITLARVPNWYAEAVVL